MELSPLPSFPISSSKVRQTRKAEQKRTHVTRVSRLLVGTILGMAVFGTNFLCSMNNSISFKEVRIASVEL